MVTCKPIILHALCCLLLLTGFEQRYELPAEIKKVDLKLYDEEVAITFLSLSNGESTLLQNSEGEGILINTGHADSREELKRALNVFGITKLQEIIITRIDSHYIGNLKWLIQQYEIEKVIIPPSVSDKELLLSNLSVPLVKWSEGKVEDDLFGISAEVVQHIESETTMNIMLQFGKNRILFMSIANDSYERNLVQQYHLKDVNVLKIGDFGKETGTSQKLLEAVDPQVAIIFQTRDGYPSADVLERLQSTWIDIYYTKQFGNVTIKCNEEQYEVITFSVESMNRW